MVIFTDEFPNECVSLVTDITANLSGLQYFKRIIDMGR